MNTSSVELPTGYEATQFTGRNDIALVQRVGKLRYRVWRDEPTRLVGDFPDETWLDEAEEESEHWIVNDASGQLVAAARLTLYDNIYKLPNRDRCNYNTAGVTAPVAYFTRDVVISAHRNQGLGNYFNIIRIMYAEKLNAKFALADIPDYRIRKFEDLGFKTIREPRLGIKLPDLRWSIVAKDLTRA